MRLTGADLLISELKRQGVTFISTLCGNGLNPLYLSCQKAGIRLIDTHNEQAAAYMADAYARLTGRIGVCAVSSGVAHVNALTGVANAFFDGSPLLLITGASAGYGADRGVFQEFDQVALAEPICKYAKCVNRVSDLLFLTRQAFAKALCGRPGPVHLTIPADVLEAEVDAPSETVKDSISDIPSTGIVEPELISEAVRAIERSRHPLIIAGSGVFYTKSQDAMIRFSEATAIPIVTPIWDRGVVDKPHTHFLGVIGAESGEPELLEDADLIILAGARVDCRVGYLMPPKVSEKTYIIRIESDPGEMNQGIEPDLCFLSTPAQVFNLLAKTKGLEKKTQHNQWLKEAQERWRLFYSRWNEVDQSTINGWHIAQAIQPLLEEDIVFLIDGGNIGQWTHMLLANNRYPTYWLTCGASAVVGWGIPGAMAAKLAYPERRVLLLSGDGSFGFTTTELESAVRQNLPFVAVVANDKTWGIAASVQMRRYGQEGVIASSFGSIRFDKIAEAVGAQGARIEDPNELLEAIEEGFSANSPVVIDIPIDTRPPFDIGRVDNR